MPSEEQITAAVERLADALETRVPCAAVRDLIGTDDLAAAYAVQQGLVRKRLDLGATVVGRKIGATSKAVQDQLGVDQPDFGYLLDEMDVSDDTATQGAISMRRLVQPRVEAEVAFVMAADVDPASEEEITIDLVRDAADGVVGVVAVEDGRLRLHLAGAVILATGGYGYLYARTTNPPQVAGAAREHPTVLIFGLALSVVLMGVAASLIARLLSRHRWIAWVGLAIILYVALHMIWEGWHDIQGRMNGAEPPVAEAPAH